MDISFKNFNFLGVISLPWLLLNVVLFAELQHSYSHMNNYVSELGAIKANYSVFMNIFGFIITRVFIVCAGIGSWYSLKKINVKNYSSLSMVVFGLMFSLIAVPMDYPGKYHYFFALYALVPFYLSVLLSLLVVHKLHVNILLKFIAYLLALCVLIDFAFQFDLPVGLYQRITLGLVFGWFSFFSFLIMMSDKKLPQELSL